MCFDTQHIGLLVRTFGGDVYKIQDVQPREGTLTGNLLGDDGRPTGRLTTLPQYDCTETAYDLTWFARTGELRPLE